MVSEDFEKVANCISKSFIDALNTDAYCVDSSRECDVRAEIVIADIDEDGVVYGYVQYLKSGSDKPFYIVYLYGNATKDYVSKDESIAAAVKTATTISRARLFK